MLATSSDKSSECVGLHWKGRLQGSVNPPKDECLVHLEGRKCLLHSMCCNNQIQHLSGKKLLVSGELIPHQFPTEYSTCFYVTGSVSIGELGNLVLLQGTLPIMSSTADRNISVPLSTLKDVSTTGDLASLTAVLRSEACG